MPGATPLWRDKPTLASRPQPDALELSTPRSRALGPADTDKIAHRLHPKHIARALATPTSLRPAAGRGLDTQDFAHAPQSQTHSCTLTLTHTHAHTRAAKHARPHTYLHTTPSRPAGTSPPEPSWFFPHLAIGCRVQLSDQMAASSLATWRPRPV